MWCEDGEERKKERKRLSKNQCQCGVNSHITLACVEKDMDYLALGTKKKRTINIIPVVNLHFFCKNPKTVRNTSRDVFDVFDNK